MIGSADPLSPMPVGLDGPLSVARTARSSVKDRLRANTTSQLLAALWIA